MKHKTIAVLCASAVVLIIACLIAGELPPEGGGAASQNVSPALGQPSGILPDGQDESAASSGASAESSAAAANADEMVWIPQSGAKYHTRADCGNMIAPRQVTQSEAERLGYTPCRRCH